MFFYDKTSSLFSLKSKSAELLCVISKLLSQIVTIYDQELRPNSLFINSVKYSKFYYLPSYISFLLLDNQLRNHQLYQKEHLATSFACRTHYFKTKSVPACIVLYN
jgi:hypothetical protein